MECVNNWWLLERPPVRPYSARCHIPRNVIELTVSILIFIVIKTKEITRKENLTPGIMWKGACEGAYISKWHASRIIIELTDSLLILMVVNTKINVPLKWMINNQDERWHLWGDIWLGGMLADWLFSQQIAQRWFEFCHDWWWSLWVELNICSLASHPDPHYETIPLIWQWFQVSGCQNGQTVILIRVWTQTQGMEYIGSKYMGLNCTYIELIGLEQRMKQ